MKRVRQPVPAFLFVRWPKLRVWHAVSIRERGAMRTVCGLPFDNAKVILGWATPETWAEAEGKCKSCERMKDADTMRGPTGEV